MAKDHSDERETQPIINIVGEKVALGPRGRDLMPLYTKWHNDFEVIRTLTAQLRPTMVETVQTRNDAYWQQEDNALFTIYERATMRPIGHAGLHQISHARRTAEFGITIGEKDCWNKGYGTETTVLTLDYGFNGLGLHNIMLSAFAFNESGLRAYVRAGFKEFGRRRQAIWIGGKPYDMVYMDCLATEFESRVMRQYLPQ